MVARIRQHDRDLGEQLRRALSSAALNVAEGNRREGGTRLSRFSTAAGSNSEARAALVATHTMRRCPVIAHVTISHS